MENIQNGSLLLFRLFELNIVLNHNWKLTSNLHQFNYHSGSNFIYHSTRGKIGEYHMSLYARVLNVNIDGDDIHDSFSWCTFQVHIPPRLKCTFNSKMIRCGTGGVIFIGGHYAPPQGLSFKNLRVDLHDNKIDTYITDQAIPNHTLWHGELSSCGNDMFWNAIDLGIFFIRPIGFKLKNSLFIMHLNPIPYSQKSNNVCDKYDLLRKQYHHKVFELPFESSLSIDEPKIVTDRNETFALIVIKEEIYNESSERIWIFTESDGFKEMTDLESRNYYLNGLLIRII